MSGDALPNKRACFEKWSLRLNFKLRAANSGAANYGTIDGY